MLGTVRPCPACSQPATYEGIMDGYCNAEFGVYFTIFTPIISENKNEKFLT